MASSSTIYYPPPETHQSLANPMAIMNRDSTSARVDFVNDSVSLKRRKIHNDRMDDIANGLNGPLELPPPGPDHYRARRMRWLNQQTASSSSSSTLSSSTDTKEREKIRDKITVLLSKNGSERNDDIWNTGLRTVSRGLLAGSRLRKPLALQSVIKILHATWIRDGTWPSQSSVPESTSEEDNDGGFVVINSQEVATQTLDDKQESESNDHSSMLPNQTSHSMVDNHASQSHLIEEEEEEDEIEEGIIVER